MSTSQNSPDKDGGVVAYTSGAETDVTGSRHTYVEKEHEAVVASEASSEKLGSGLAIEFDEAVPKRPDTQYVGTDAVINTGVDVSRFLVSTRDDGDPSLTFRGVVLGTALTGLTSTLAILYWFKPYQVNVSLIFVQLLCFFLGEAWAKLTPKPERFPKWFQSTARFLNFGQPFTIKEHVVASLIASSGNNGLSGVENFAIQRLFYNQTPSASTVVLAIFSISLCGYTLAGLFRSLVVYPAEMVYWTTLPQIILFQKLHHDRDQNQKRMRKFWYAFSVSFLWEWFPAYVWPFMGGVSIPCLASMKSSLNTRSTVSIVSGGVSSDEGLGIMNFGFDWQYITSQYLSYPLKQQVNIWVGLVIFYIAMPLLYYKNAWNTLSDGMPFMSTSLFTDNGTVYNQTLILNEHNIVDEAKLEAYGVPYLNSSTVWGFFTQNLAIGALITHVILFHGKEMWTAFKQARNQTQPDEHYQGMLKYKEVPQWWYLVLGLLAFLAGVIVCATGDTTLPVWAYIVALIVGAFMAPFSTILYGLFGSGVSTNQLSKMIAGAVLPHRPIAGLYFASWSHQVILLCVNLANWLKVGQYLKIPHRVMFVTQIYASLLGAGLNYAVMSSVVTNKREILLNPEGNNIWSGSNAQSFNAQAITWALAKDMYGIGTRYYIVPLGIIIGAVFPVLHKGAEKLFPRIRGWPLNMSLILYYAGDYYFGNTAWIWSSIAVGWFSQVYLRRKRPGLYNKYNYLIGAALDGGSQVVIFILSFAVYGTAGVAVSMPFWWGNVNPGTNNVQPDYCVGQS